MNKGIYSINADGTDKKVIIQDPFSISPMWSPDGSKIAYINGSRDLVVANIDDVDSLVLTHNLLVIDSPAWSPDSSKIAFTVTGHNSNLDGLYVINVDGTELEQILKNSNARLPGWSKDGEHIVFMNGGVFVMPLNTNVPQKISDRRGSYPRWLANGEQIAYYSDSNVISVINYDGTGNRVLATLPQTPDRTSDWFQVELELSLSDLVIEKSIEEFLDAESVRLPNCGGTEPLEYKALFTRSISREVTMSFLESKSTCTGNEAEWNVGAELDVEKWLSWLPLKVNGGFKKNIWNETCSEIQSSFAVKENETITEGREITLRAAAETSVTYELEWVLVKQVGHIDISSGNDFERLSFQLPDRIHTVIVDSKRNECL